MIPILDLGSNLLQIFDPEILAEMVDKLDTDDVSILVGHSFDDALTNFSFDTLGNNNEPICMPNR